MLGVAIPGCLGAGSCSYVPGPGTPVTPVLVNDIMKANVTCDFLPQNGRKE